MPLKIIIVDDEQLARQLLQDMIRTVNPTYEIVALCHDLTEAIKAIHIHQPDLVFLDIDMPRYKGLEINQFIPDINFDIVFTTAHQQFAINAIKLGAFDYLLKPIDFDELTHCLERLEEKNLAKTNLPDITESRLVVNTAQNIYLIDYNKIQYFKAEGAYTKIVTDDAQITASKNLKHYEDLFTERQEFVRVHKSYIVNKLKVEVVHKAKQQVLLANGHTIQIAMDRLDTIL